MSSRATIWVDLRERMARYYGRYNGNPTTLPVTLDEWVWLAETFDATSTAAGYVPIEFAGAKLELVSEVIEMPDGSTVVRK